MAFSAEHKRIFGIKLGSCFLKDFVDIFKEAGGKLKVVHMYHPIEVKSQSVFFKGTDCQVSLSDKQGLKLEFIKGVADCPSVNSFLIFKGRLKGEFRRDGFLCPERDKKGL